MKRRLTALLILVLTALPLATLGAGSSFADGPGLAARLDKAIESALAEQRIVGAVVMVARDGEVIYQRAAGLADREADRPMTVDTIFRFASVTKPLVSAAALKLVEQGDLSLDDPVTRWLPDFTPTLPDGSPAEIRLYHLLTHTAGLSYGFLEPRDGPYRRAGVSDGLAKPEIGLEENLERIASVPLKFEPGSAWHYSVATDVLGAVLQAASGESLPELVRRLVTGPLDLADTAFAVRDRSRLAAAYADGTPAPMRMTGRTEVPVGEGAVIFNPERIFAAAAFPSGGAGMAGTAGDFLTFLEAIRRGGGPILSADTVRTMISDQAGVPVFLQGPGWGFGYGWAVLTDPERAETPQSKGTIQWGGAYGQSWFVDPVEALTVVAFTNTAFEGVTGRFPVEIRNAVYGR